MIKSVLLTSIIAAAANDDFKTFLEVSSHSFYHNSFDQRDSYRSRDLRLHGVSYVDSKSEYSEKHTSCSGKAALHRKFCGLHKNFLPET